MRFSDGVEWSIHCATILSGLPEGGCMAGRELAVLHGVSESYLLKHLKALTKAGILVSVSGPAGGFRLSRPADQITLLEIMEAVEGRFAPFHCTEIRQRGPLAGSPSEYRNPCGILSAMREAEDAYRQVLATRTVADIGAHVMEAVPPLRLSAMSDWIAARTRRTTAKGTRNET